jgi:uncharacterized protein with GYD domain
LEVGLVSTDVITTTTTTEQAGILEDMPRLDYSGGASCPSLLLEPQRSNVVTQSEYFGGWTNDTNTTLTPNAITSPSGLIDAYKISAGTSTARQAIKLLLTPSGDVVQSIFAKKGEYSVVQITDGRNPNLYANFDLENGVLGNYADCTPSIEEFSDGWYRCVIVYNSTLDIVNTRISIAESPTQARLVNFAGNGSDGIYLWGAMVEAGSYPTSYIPTYGASVTRSVDTCSNLSASSILNDTEGTLFMEIQGNLDSASRALTLGDGTSLNRVQIFYQSDTNITTNVISGGVSQVDLAVFTKAIDQTQNIKVIIRYASNNAKMFVNGEQIASDTSVTTPVGLDVIRFDNGTGTSPFAGDVKQLLYFPTALTDAECEQLTTI